MKLEWTTDPEEKWDIPRQYLTPIQLGRPIRGSRPITACLQPYLKGDEAFTLKDYRLTIHVLYPEKLNTLHELFARPCVFDRRFEDEDKAKAEAARVIHFLIKEFDNEGYRYREPLLAEHGIDIDAIPPKGQ